MKKQVTAAMIAMLMCCSCALQQQGVAASSQESSEAESSLLQELSSSLPEGVEPINFKGATLQFVRPEMEYEILGTTEFNDGFAVVYQEEMPDEFNKRYSSDEIFYDLCTQLFNSKGEHIKTVDSQRHNTNKLIKPLVFLQPHENTITFESWQKNETGKTSSICFILAITEEGKRELGYNPNNYFYNQREFRELTCDGEIQLQYTEVYNQETEKDELLFRLAAPEGKVSELLVDFNDASFGGALYNTAHGADDEDWLNDQSNPLYQMTASLNAKEQTAELSNGKILCQLNFAENNQGYAITRSYTKDMLCEQIGVSPDGRHRIYSADLHNYFESASGCDYVVCDQNNNISFLFAGSEMDEVHFIGNDRIWANTFGAMELYDADTGKPSVQKLGFDFGKQQNPDDKSLIQIERIVIGTAVDEVNQMLLIAHIPYNFGWTPLWEGTEKETYQFPVMLTVLDWNGKPLRHLDTKWAVYPFKMYVLNNIPVKINGDGTATLTQTFKDEKSVTINYMQA